MLRNIFFAKIIYIDDKKLVKLQVQTMTKPINFILQYESNRRIRDLVHALARVSGSAVCRFIAERFLFGISCNQKSER